MALVETLSKTFNSHSGCDIKATFAGVRIGELQGISFTISREKAPVYVMGRKDPVGFSRGKRGIAGSLVFAIFDRSALLDGLKSAQNYNSNFWTSNEELALSAYQADLDIVAGSRLTTNPGKVLLTDTTEDPRSGSYQTAPAWYLDQLPPFEIVVNAINEYGSSTTLKIYNVELLNNGTGMSIDDIMLDETMTFTCTHIVPWKENNFLDPSGEPVSPI